LTTAYIDDKILEQHEYTDQEIEALRVEGYIHEALTLKLQTQRLQRFLKILDKRISLPKFSRNLMVWVVGT
jgi:hypothetical protein